MIVLGLADEASKQAKQEIAVWFAAGTLPTTGAKDDPALEIDHVAFAWKAIRHNASRLISAGYLLRRVQEAAYHMTRSLVRRLGARFAT